MEDIKTDDDKFMEVLCTKWLSWRRTKSEPTRLHMRNVPRDSTRYVTGGYLPIVHIWSTKQELFGDTLNVWRLGCQFGNDLCTLKWHSDMQTFLFENGRFDAAEMGDEIKIDDLLPLWEEFYGQGSADTKAQEKQALLDGFHKFIPERFKDAALPLRAKLVSEIAVDETKEDDANKVGDEWSTRISLSFNSKYPWCIAQACVVDDIWNTMAKMTLTDKAIWKQLPSVSHVEYHIPADSVHKVQPTKWEFELCLQLSKQESCKRQKTC